MSLSNSEVQDILARYKKGENTADIGEALSIHNSEVSRILKKHGKAGRPGQGFTESDKQYKLRNIKKKYDETKKKMNIKKKQKEKSQQKMNAGPFYNK